MQDENKPYPLVDHDILWLLLGVGLLLLLAGWYFLVWWLTRKKVLRSVTNLAPREPVLPDMTAIRAKYLALIDEVEKSHQSGEISTRTVHQRLSVLLRFFAQEAHGLRAFSLTLSDLKKTRYDKLTEAIEQYYIPEFNEVMVGDSVSAIAKAREVVNTWL